jgi:hypothetical protein
MTYIQATLPRLSILSKIWAVLLAFFSQESSHDGDIWIRYG